MNNLKEGDLVNAFRQKAIYFFKNNIPIHLKFKANYFKNGHIIECDDDFIVINDFKSGKEIAFFLELERLEEYKMIGEIK